LAKYGFVEQAPARDHRERPWKPTATRQAFVEPADEADRAARALLERVIAERALGRLVEWQERRADAPKRWRGMGGVSNSLLYLTPAEFRALHEQVNALLEGFQDRADDRAARPRGARPVSFTYLSVPLPATGADRGGRP
jgi:hypothetical protein